LGPAISFSLAVIWFTSSSGRARQFTVALALCANALGACPAWAMVATQVLRSRPMMGARFDSRSNTSLEGFPLATARKSAFKAASCCCGALRWK
jgi:hypothetical protein